MARNLPTLYKRTVTRTIQEWTIYIEGSKYWTVSGKQGGKLVVSKPVLCESKNVGRSNETNPEEQAELEAQAKWTKKKEAGYTEEAKAVDEVVEHMVKAMLAHDYQDHKHKVEFPVYSQPKFDGLRCIVTRDGAWSRNWKPFVTLSHIRAALAPLFEEYPEVIAFDGEVYNHEYRDDFNSIVSLVKQPKATAEDIAKAKDKIEYHIYDYVSKTPVTYEQRVKELLGMLGRSTEACLLSVDTTLVLDQEELDNLMGLYLEQGYEGQMIRAASAPYQHKRTDQLLKRKEFVDREFPIIGYRQGKGNREGCIILRCQTDEGKEFDCSVKGSVEYTRKLYNLAPNLVGKQATVKYQRLTPDGIPKFLTCIKIRDNRGEELVIQ
jgi:ATP-dependent DNA ligase